MAAIILKNIKAYLEQSIFRVFRDETYLKLYYRFFIGRKLDLEHPKGYNEKLQWLKLHDRNPKYIQLVDKYQAKQIAAEMIGAQYITPVIAGPWKSVEEIESEKLPNKFVLKTSHDSGGVVICEDKQTFDWKKAKKKLKKALRYNYYYVGREWPYKNIDPCIFAEQYLESEDAGGLVDYKFMCFDGIPKLMFTVTERTSGIKVDFFDMDFNHLPIVRHYPNSVNQIKKPEHFELMKELARKLAKDFPHVRIDFYEIDGRIFFGEWTFYPGNGLEEFASYEEDLKIGEMITVI